jgi:hypothetical protein
MFEHLVFQLGELAQVTQDASQPAGSLCGIFHTLLDLVPAFRLAQVRQCGLQAGERVFQLMVQPPQELAMGFIPLARHFAAGSLRSPIPGYSHDQDENRNQEEKEGETRSDPNAEDKHRFRLPENRGEKKRQDSESEEGESENDEEMFQGNILTGAMKQ